MYQKESYNASPTSNPEAWPFYLSSSDETEQAATTGEQNGYVGILRQLGAQTDAEMNPTPWVSLNGTNMPLVLMLKIINFLPLSDMINFLAVSTQCQQLVERHFQENQLYFRQSCYISESQSGFEKKWDMTAQAWISEATEESDEFSELLVDEAADELKESSKLSSEESETAQERLNIDYHRVELPGKSSYICQLGLYDWSYGPVLFSDSLYNLTAIQPTSKKSDCFTGHTSPVTHAVSLTLHRVVSVDTGQYHPAKRPTLMIWTMNFDASTSQGENYLASASIEKPDSLTALSSLTAQAFVSCHASGKINFWRYKEVLSCYQSISLLQPAWAIRFTHATQFTALSYEPNERGPRVVVTTYHLNGQPVLKKDRFAVAKLYYFDINLDCKMTPSSFFLSPDGRVRGLFLNEALTIYYSVCAFSTNPASTTTSSQCEEIDGFLPIRNRDASQSVCFMEGDSTVACFRPSFFNRHPGRGILMLDEPLIGDFKIS